jgi:hypothetical protein
MADTSEPFAELNVGQAKAEEGQSGGRKDDVEHVCPLRSCDVKGNGRRAGIGKRGSQPGRGIGIP